MVKNVTSYTGNGLRDWLVQRVSAVVLSLYFLLLLYIFISNPGLDYATWQGLYSQMWMKVFTLLALLSLFAHSWIGIWTVLTDYIKPACLRVAIEVIVILALLGYLIWGIEIVWSI